MIDAQLPSPGLIPNGPKVRTELARAISYVEVVGGMQGGKLAQAKTLDTFLVAARAAIASFIDTVVPTYVSSLITNTARTKLVLTFSEALDPAHVPAASAFTTSPARTISAVEVVGTKVHLTVTAAFVAGATTVAYTKPGSGSVLKDLSGNDVATFAAQSVTNQIV